MTPLDALRELVRLKDIKERMEAIGIDRLGSKAHEYTQLCHEYEPNKEKAWQAARAALAEAAPTPVSDGWVARVRRLIDACEPIAVLNWDEAHSSLELDVAEFLDALEEVRGYPAPTPPKTGESV